MIRLFRFTLVFLLSYQSVACQAKTDAQKADVHKTETPSQFAEYTAEDTVINHEGLNEIRSRYEETRIAPQESGDNDPYWTPEVLLPKLSSWFTPGRGLWKREMVSDSYLMYYLAPLPEELIAELNQILLKNRYSLAILTSQFWLDVQKAQKQGLQVAFISSKSPSTASGVYFNSLGLIGLHIFSEPGTLPHELRHHEQYKYIRLNYSPKYLELSCLRQMSRAFGEIDATTFELHLYNGIETEFNELISGGKPGSLHLRFPQVNLLDINLNYPLTMSQMIKSSVVCPPEVTKPMEDLTAYFSQKVDALNSLMREIRLQTIQLRTTQQKLYEDDCDVQNAPNCEKLTESFNTTQEKLVTAQENFRVNLAQEASDRSKKLSATLAQMPSLVRKDLCKGAIGVHFYMNCESKK